VESKDWTLEWEQRDNFRGFQQLRGLNGEPGHVKMIGFKRYSAKPGVYGEFMTVDEEMMALRAATTREGEPVNIDDLVTERQDYLNNRESDLLEYIHWAALLNGNLSFIGPTGAIYGDEWPIQTANFSDWSVLTTATPLADLMTLKALASGKSVAFDSGATIYANSVTIGYLLQNKNANDLGGQLALTSGGVKPVKSLLEINTMLNGFNLPTIVEYDEGYNAESNGAFTKWIPNDVMSLVGRRTDGSSLGQYRMVRNPQNENASPGRYEMVIDRVKDRVPRIIEVHRGHNGGLVIFYGSAIVRINC
jgi:hypothetical protein